MMINQIRYQQQLQQLKQGIRSGVSTVVNYGTRDPITGLRTIETADGGVAQVKYLSNSEPEAVPAVAQFSTIGLSGYISQRPH
jgi:hypothetical protein